MEIIDTNIVDFYKYCLDSADRRGFKWVLCLLAREADAERTYVQIARYWDSLHDLTGGEILFVFAGKFDEQERYASMIHNEQVGWRVFQNKLLHFSTQHRLTLPDFKYPNRDYNNHRYEKIVSSHTGSISELCKYFGLSERDVPSLVFTPTYRPMREKHVVIKLKQDNIYQQLKDLIVHLEGTLGILSSVKKEYEDTKANLNKLLRQISIINYIYIYLKEMEKTNPENQRHTW